MDKDISQIRVRGHLVGVAGLEQILKEVRELNLTQRLRITAELLRRTRMSNFIPESAEQDYAQALYREYCRSLGEDVSDESRVLEIRVLGPGCPRCEELMRRVRNAVAELDVLADIEHLRDLDEISSYGPIATPGLVVNGKVVSTGKIPALHELKKMLA